MSDDSTQARRTLYLWALGLNVVAWGGYLVLTKVMGIDFESIRQARLAGYRLRCFTDCSGHLSLQTPFLIKFFLLCGWLI